MYIRLVFIANETHPGNVQLIFFYVFLLVRC